MLPKFIHREHVGDEFFFDYSRGGWVQGAAILDQLAGAARELEQVALPTPSAEGDILPLPATAPIRPHSPTVTTADFDSVDGDSIPPVAATPTIRRRV